MNMANVKRNRRSVKKKDMGRWRIGLSENKVQEADSGKK